MPPFHVDRTIGIQKFKNDPSLTQREIDTIVKWVDAGAPRGNPADMPPLRQFGDHATPGRSATPDLIVKFPKYLVPAESARPLRRPLRRHPGRRGPLHQGDPDTIRDGRIAQGRPPRALVYRAAGRHPGRYGDRWRPVPRRVRLRQERRGLPGRVRRAPEGGREGARQLSHCTPTAKTRTWKSSSGSCSIRRATCRTTSGGRRSSRSRRRRSISRRTRSLVRTATSISTSRRG